MEIASVVFEHNFDQAMLDQIDTLRTLRLNLAEQMLADMERTSQELKERGLAADMDADELRTELESRIAQLRERLQRPDVVFADEIDFYVDLLDEEMVEHPSDP